jgi:nuclear pore complex protein Nup93
MFIGESHQESAGVASSMAVRSANECNPHRDKLLNTRANLARIEERSRQLNGATRDELVMRPIHALAEYAQAENDVSARMRGPGDASGELFMANLGFNVQEQQRRLQHIKMTRPPPVSSLAVHDDPERGAALSVQTDLAGFIASRRNEALHQLVGDVQASAAEREREHLEAVMGAAWDQRKMDLAETAGMRSLLQSAGGVAGNSMLLIGGGAANQSSMMNNSTATRHSSSALLTTSTAEPAPSQAVLSKRVLRFSEAVRNAGPAQWLQLFAEVAYEEQDTAEASELWKTWSVAQKIVAQLPPPGSDAGEAPPVLQGVAASRHVLEEDYMMHVFEAVQHNVASQFNELRRIDARRFQEVVRQYAQGGSEWLLIYTAMRCGRYDTARLFASDANVGAALKVLADMPPMARQAAKLPTHVVRELTELYGAVPIARDPHRATVLLVLLAARVGNDDAAAAAVTDCCDNMVEMVEDLLWVRLTVVRAVAVAEGGSANALAVQTLEDLQRKMVSGRQELLYSVSHNADHLVRLLLHALLPAAAVLIMMDRHHVQMADAVHMAMVFHAYRLVDVAPRVDTALDLATVLQRFTASIAGATAAGAAHSAGGAVFSYFERTHHTQAYVEMCAASPALCTAFFGARGTAVASGAVSDALLEAMEHIADQAAATGHVSIAMNVRLSLHALVADTDKPRAAACLEAAFRVVNPQLVNGLSKLLAGVASSLDDVFAVAESLQQSMRRSAHQLPAAAVEAFEQLLAVARVVAAANAENHSAVLFYFRQLSFVPAPGEQHLSSHVAEDVVAVMPRVLLMALRALQRVGHGQRDMAEVAVLEQWHNGHFRGKGGKNVEVDIRKEFEKLKMP